MAHHGDDFLVDELLRYLGCGLRIGGVVFRHQFQLDRLAVDGQACLVGFFNREACTVFVIFAQVSNLARQWCNVTDFNDNCIAAPAGGSRRGRCRSGTRIGLLFFLLTACRQQRHCGDYGQYLRELELHVIIS